MHWHSQEPYVSRSSSCWVVPLLPTPRWDLGLVTKVNHRSSSLFYKGSTLQGCDLDVIALYLNGDMNPPILAMTGTSSESVVTDVVCSWGSFGPLPTQRFDPYQWLPRFRSLVCRTASRNTFTPPTIFRSSSLWRLAFLFSPPEPEAPSCIEGIRDVHNVLVWDRPDKRTMFFGNGGNPHCEANTSFSLINPLQLPDGPDQ